MNRYQIYLNPNSVNTLDRLSKLTDLSRSQIIRDIIDKMAREYEKLIAAAEKRRIKNNPLLKMAGMAKGGSKNISKNIDEIYLID